MAYKRVSPLPIVEGGTNATSMATTDGVSYFDGTRVVTTAVGTAGQVLTSNGAGVAPTFQNQTGTAAVTSIAGNSGGARTGALTVTGGTSGIKFGGVGTTQTMSASFFNLPNTTSNTNGVIRYNSQVLLHNFGTNNIWIGKGAGNFTTTGTSLTAFGSSSFNSVLGNSVNCVCMGANSRIVSGFSRTTTLTSAASGASADDSIYINTGSGPAAGSVCFGSTGQTNQHCVGMGFGWGLSMLNTSSYVIAFGSNISGGGASFSNTIKIGQSGSGNDQQNQCFIGGINGIVVTGTAVLVSATDQLGVAASSQRFKTDIQDMGSTNVLDLRPVTFLWKKDSTPGLADASDDKQFGLIAEEVNQFVPQLVAKDKENKPFSVHYRDLSVLILNEIKKLKQTIYEIKLKKGVL